MKCSKVSYPSKQAALTDAKLIRAYNNYRNTHKSSNKKNGRKIRTYECRYCGKWHLTTTKYRNKKFKGHSHAT